MVKTKPSTDRDTRLGRGGLKAIHSFFEHKYIGRRRYSGCTPELKFESPLG
jgi:hypothetical protein